MSTQKLYFRNGKSASSLKELIDLLYREDNGIRQVTARTTYCDEKCEVAECYSARRSFEDLLAISRTYFPETTEVELMKVLKELDMSFWYCSDIKKLVFFYAPSHGAITSASLDNPTLDSYLRKDTYTGKQLAKICNQIK
jgi:hypothetical protein